MKSLAVAAIASVPAAAALWGDADRWIALGLGLSGVVLARTVFIDRQNSRLKRKQSLRETLPLTGAAMLAAGAIIWDRQPTLSNATFLGLGIGWTAVVLLNMIGDRVLLAFGMKLPPSGAPILEVLPLDPELKEKLALLDNEKGVGED